MDLHNEIKKQLMLLEDAFYDGISNDLLRDKHIMQFSHRMEIIHQNILNLTLRKNSQDMQMASTGNISNLNYSQLSALGSKPS